MSGTSLASGPRKEDTRILAGTELIVSIVALLAIYLLSVTADPFREPSGGLTFVPYALLVVTYVLAFGSFVRRVT
ncbi:MAG: hypothetical protein ACE5LS_08315 [Thermoplasmata archaeon]